MRNRGRSSAFALLAVLGCLLPHASVADEPAELAIIVHPTSEARLLSASQLRSMFTRILRDWPDGKPITPVNFSTTAAERAVFDRIVLGMDPDEVAQFWIDKRIRGDSPPPRQLASAAAIMDLVSRTPGAIGYVPQAMLKPHVKVVARIRRNQVVVP